MAATKHEQHGMGLIRQKPDHRDYLFQPAKGLITPRRVDLRTSPHRMPIGDQGRLGSCTAWSAIRIARFAYGKDGWHNPFTPSALAQYYWTRQIEGTTGTDSGAQMRDAMKALVLYGMTAETNCPYDIARFTEPPTAAAQQNAYKHKATVYQAVPLTLDAMIGCLASGWPFQFGFTVYRGFLTEPAASTGVVPMPQPGEQIMGGHAQVAVGFDMDQQVIITDNSWTAAYGDHGSMHFSFAYLTDPQLAYDGWVVTTQR